mmetsp:Transcript_56042/g.181731  ORF Transcript_56042/g.181731 Transcript_56042/m.181731 type:complete len:1023 (-) Transcript_56042:107-3175(-)
MPSACLCLRRSFLFWVFAGCALGAPEAVVASVGEDGEGCGQAPNFVLASDAVGNMPPCSGAAVGDAAVGDAAVGDVPSDEEDGLKRTDYSTNVAETWSSAEPADDQFLPNASDTEATITSSTTTTGSTFSSASVCGEPRAWLDPTTSMVRIAFGPTFVHGRGVDELGVVAYEVYLASCHGLRSGLALASLRARGLTTRSCCEVDAYVAGIPLDVALNATDGASATFVVVPVTLDFGALPVGRLSNLLELATARGPATSATETLTATVRTTPAPRLSDAYATSTPTTAAGTTTSRTTSTTSTTSTNSSTTTTSQAHQQGASSATLELIIVAGVVFSIAFVFLFVACSFTFLCLRHCKGQPCFATPSDKQGLMSHEESTVDVRVDGPAASSDRMNMRPSSPHSCPSSAPNSSGDFPGPPHEDAYCGEPHEPFDCASPARGASADVCEEPLPDNLSPSSHSSAAENSDAEPDLLSPESAASAERAHVSSVEGLAAEAASDERAGFSEGEWEGVGPPRLPPVPEVVEKFSGQKPIAGVFDGRWMHKSEQCGWGIEVVKGDRIRVAAGKMAKMRFLPGMRFSVKIHGARHVAQCRDGELCWDDGTVWTRAPHHEHKVTLLTGQWAHSSGGTVCIQQDGDSLTIHNSRLGARCVLLSEFDQGGSLISYFGHKGKLEDDRICWSNGTCWTKVSCSVAVLAEDRPADSPNVELTNLNEQAFNENLSAVAEAGVHAKQEPQSVAEVDEWHGVSTNATPMAQEPSTRAVLQASLLAISALRTPVVVDDTAAGPGLTVEASTERDLVPLLSRPATGDDSAADSQVDVAAHDKPSESLLALAPPIEASPPSTLPKRSPGPSPLSSARVYPAMASAEWATGFRRLELNSSGSRGDGSEREKAPSGEVGMSTPTRRSSRSPTAVAAAMSSPSVADRSEVIPRAPPPVRVPPASLPSAPQPSFGEDWASFSGSAFADVSDTAVPLSPAECLRLPGLPQLPELQLRSRKAAQAPPVLGGFCVPQSCADAAVSLLELSH